MMVHDVSPGAWQRQWPTAVVMLLLFLSRVSNDSIIASDEPRRSDIPPTAVVFLLRSSRRKELTA